MANEPFIFGPVPSRRLGASLGVDNIRSHTCSYSCLYCQLGRTRHLKVERETYYYARDIACSVQRRVASIREQGLDLDYVTLVADGEPALDSNLGKEIELLRENGVPIAVITNASLIWRDDVRRDLYQADWVSLKVDAASPEVWHTINRPHGSLILEKICDGIVEFARSFKGRLATETMLLNGINDSVDEVAKISNFLRNVNPDIAYLSLPTRPPAEKVYPADENALNVAYQTFRSNLSTVECLVGDEGDMFAASGDAFHDLLSITSVHPMRRHAAEQLIARNGEDTSLLDRMVKDGYLKEVEYEGDLFYVRSFSGKNREQQNGP